MPNFGLGSPVWDPANTDWEIFERERAACTKAVQRNRRFHLFTPRLPTQAQQDLTASSSPPLLADNCKKSCAERTGDEARTHLKWSWRATLKSKASPRSTKPTPMKARRPGEGGRVRAGIAKQQREGIPHPAHPHACRLLQLELGLRRLRYGTGDMFSLLGAHTALVKTAFKLI